MEISTIEPNYANAANRPKANLNWTYRKGCDFNSTNCEGHVVLNDVKFDVGHKATTRSRAHIYDVRECTRDCVERLLVTVHWQWLTFGQAMRHIAQVIQPLPKRQGESGVQQSSGCTYSHGIHVIVCQHNCIELFDLLNWKCFKCRLPPKLGHRWFQDCQPTVLSPSPHPVEYASDPQHPQLSAPHLRSLESCRCMTEA